MQQIGLLSLVMNREGECRELPLKNKKHVTARTAAANGISADAAVAAVLAEFDVVVWIKGRAKNSDEDRFWW